MTSKPSPPARPRCGRAMRGGILSWRVGTARLSGQGSHPRRRSAIVSSFENTGGLSVGHSWPLPAYVCRTCSASRRWELFGITLAPEQADAIVAAAHTFLVRAGPAVILASACHADWIQAFRKRRFRNTRRSRHYRVSPSLAPALVPFKDRARECFFTFVDGQGRQGRLGNAMFGD